jgi:hypothetical protein
MLHYHHAAPPCAARARAAASPRRPLPTSRLSTTIAPRAWFGLGGNKSSSSSTADKEAASLADQPSALPASHDQAIRQAQLAAERALKDGLRLLEVDFPPVTIGGVAGDGDGQGEMNDNLRHMRRFVGVFRDRAEKVRIFFGDPSEAAVAVGGATMDPAAGRAKTEPAFPRIPGEPRFQISYLTRPNALWSITGVNFDKWSASGQVKSSDEVFVIAYPTFNAKEELKSARQVWDAECEGPGNEGRAMIVFNGELEKLRNGYYPRLLYRELAAIGSEWLPQMETVYSVRNFRGSRPGALVRSYPGLWTLYRRDPLADEDDEDSAASAVAVWSSARRPSLKEVAMELLPNSDKAYKEALAQRRR